MNNVEIDDKKVKDFFKELSSKERIKAQKLAIKKASQILVKEAKRNLKNSVKNAKKSTSLISGIKSKVVEDDGEVFSKIHILGDFRLKFFELGTKVRKLRKNNANRGVINPTYFFKTAKDSKEKEVISSINELLIQSILKVYNK
jgi:hypothetical protein